jgi:hypothetical protein
VTDPEHRQIELPIDVVTLAHMIENAIWSIDYAGKYEDGDAPGEVPLTHQMAALCAHAGVDFAGLCRVARGLSADEACSVCNGAAVVRKPDGSLSPQPAEVAARIDACPGCGGTGLADDHASLRSSEARPLLDAKLLEVEHARLEKYVGILETYLELTVAAVRDKSPDIERVLRGAEQILALRVDVGL